MSGVVFWAGVVLMILAVPVSAYAWTWAVRAAFQARLAVVEADEARRAHEAAAALLDGERARLAGGRRLSLVSEAAPVPPWPPAKTPAAAERPRRCAMCGSTQEPLITEFIGAAESKSAVWYCRDADECTTRSRKAVLQP